MLSIVRNEQQVLACLLDKPEFYDHIEANYFVSTIASALYETVGEVAKQQLPLTPTHIVSIGNSKNSAITESLITELLNVDRDTQHFFTYYYPRLKRDYSKWRIENKLLRDILNETSSKGDLDVQKLEGFRNELDSHLELIRGRGTVLEAPNVLLERYREAVVGRVSGENRYSFGDSRLDRMLTEGAAPGKITMLFGATGVGKSAFAFNMCGRCINKHIPSVYDSLEMDGISSMDRLIAMRHRIPYSHLFPDSDGEIRPQVFQILEYERKRFGNSKSFFFVEEPNQSLEDVRMIAREAKKRMGVEYLIYFADLYTMFKDSGSDPREMEDAMNRLHEIVRSENIHFVGVVQANREAETGRPRDLEDLDKFKPTINNIKNSGAIAERSRIVLSIFRPKYYAIRFFGDNEDYAEEVEAMDDIATVSVLKQNAGGLSSIKYHFFPEYYLYYPVAYDNPLRHYNTASQREAEEERGE